MTQDYSDLYGLFGVDMDQFVAAIKTLPANGVVSGLAVSQRGAGANMSVDVASGKARVDGTIRTFASVTNVAITAADATNPRKDLVVINAAGTVVVRAGTAAAADPIGATMRQASTPDPPEMTAGDVVLAEVWVPANDTTIENAQISDRRTDVAISPFGDGLRVANEFPGADIALQINAAAGDLPTNGGVVIVRSGDYTVTNAITLGNKDNVWLMGMGPSSTHITRSDNLGSIVLLLGTLLRAWFSGIRFTNTATSASWKAIDLSGADYCRVFGCEFDGSSMQIRCVGSTYLQIVGNTFTIAPNTVSTDLLHLDGQSGVEDSEFIITRNAFEFTGTWGSPARSAIFLNFVSRAIVAQNHFVSPSTVTATQFILLTDQASLAPVDQIYSSNTFRGSPKGINALNSDISRAIIVGNTFEGFTGSAIEGRFVDSTFLGNIFRTATNSITIVSLGANTKRNTYIGNRADIAAAASATKMFALVSGSDDHFFLGNKQTNGAASTDAGSGNVWYLNPGVGMTDTYRSTKPQVPNFATLTPAAAILPASGAPTLAQIDGTNVSYKVLDFADAATQTAFWLFAIPPGWVERDVVFKIRWRPTSAITGNVVWDVAVLGRVEGEAIDTAPTAFGNTTGDAAPGTLGQLAEFAITFAAASFDLVAYDLLVVRIQRLGAHANDTMTDTARLVEVTLELT